MINHIRDEFKTCWKFLSLKFGFILTSISTMVYTAITVWPDTASVIWASAPQELKVLLPMWFVKLVPIVIFVMASLNRILKNKVVKDAKRSSNK